MNLNIAFILLLSSAFVLMFTRIRLPVVAKTVGKPVGEIRLSFKERLQLQRLNIYAIGIILVAAVATGHLSTIWALIVSFAVIALLIIPVRYIITSKGLAMNNVVFRSWEEFTGFEINRRGIRLLPQEGLKPFDLRVMDDHEEELIVLLHRCSRYGGPETQILRKAVMPLTEPLRESNS